MLFYTLMLVWTITKVQIVVWESREREGDGINLIDKQGVMMMAGEPEWETANHCCSLNFSNPIEYHSEIQQQTATQTHGDISANEHVYYLNTAGQPHT